MYIPNKTSNIHNTHIGSFHIYNEVSFSGSDIIVNNFV
jgi:hypothetical protein